MAAAAATSSTTSGDYSSYHCIQCLEPADALYQQYSESTIKLSQCRACCAGVVDAYCEREWLLVVIDIVLLRQEAYRHVLFNRLKEFRVGTSYIKSLQYIVLSSILQAYLLWEAHRYQNNNNPGDDDNAVVLLEVTVWWFFYLILASVLRFLALGIGIYLISTRALFLSSSGTNKADGDSRNAVFQTHLYLALLLPTTFQVVTILVHVWEKTDTIRLLGSLLTYSYQFTAVKTALSLLRTDNQWARHVIPLVGVCFPAAVGLLLSRAIPSMPLPCTGWEQSIPGTTLVVCVP